MLKKEFLKLTGLSEISDEKYGIIETIYNYSDFDKREFCYQFMNNKQNFTFKMIQDYVKRISNEYEKKIKSYNNELKVLSNIAFRNLKYLEDAETIFQILKISKSEQIRIKILNKIALNDSDLDYISIHI